MEGIGVHSGKPVTITLHPAIPQNGITFIRTDLGGERIKADWQSVVSTQQCTTIGNKAGATVSTIEHLMAALAAEGIDNICIEINGPEMPIMDGSAAPFVELLHSAGLQEQKNSRQVFRVMKPVVIEENNRKVSLIPSDQFEIEINFDFADRVAFEKQTFNFIPSSETFIHQVASARTFGLLEDAEKIRSMGLAKGASLDNTVVFDGATVLNHDGLRYVNECARHKALDALGDLHLAGGLILGKFYGLRSGHGLHVKLLKTLFSDSSAWSLEA